MSSPGCGPVVHTSLGPTKNCDRWVWDDAAGCAVRRGKAWFNQNPGTHRVLLAPHDGRGAPTAEMFADGAQLVHDMVACTVTGGRTTGRRGRDTRQVWPGESLRSDAVKVLQFAPYDHLRRAYAAAHSSDFEFKATHAPWALSDAELVRLVTFPRTGPPTEFDGNRVEWRLLADPALWIEAHRRVPEQVDAVLDGVSTELLCDVAPAALAQLRPQKFLEVCRRDPSCIVSSPATELALVRLDPGEFVRACQLVQGRLFVSHLTLAHLAEHDPGRFVELCRLYPRRALHEEFATLFAQHAPAEFVAACEAEPVAALGGPAALVLAGVDPDAFDRLTLANPALAAGSPAAELFAQQHPGEFVTGCRDRGEHSLDTPAWEQYARLAPEEFAAAAQDAQFEWLERLPCGLHVARMREEDFLDWADQDMGRALHGSLGPALFELGPRRARRAAGRAAGNVLRGPAAAYLAEHDPGFFLELAHQDPAAAASGPGGPALAALDLGLFTTGCAADPEFAVFGPARDLVARHARDAYLHGCAARPRTTLTEFDLSQFTGPELRRFGEAVAATRF